MATDLKMSQFDVTSPLPSGSYFILVTPDGVATRNSRVSSEDVYKMLTATYRWKPVPADSFAPGSDGDEALDSTHYYIHFGGIWNRYSPTGVF